MSAMMWGFGGLAGLSIINQLIKTLYGGKIQKGTLDLQRSKMKAETKGMKQAFEYKEKSADKAMSTMMAMRSQDRQTASTNQQNVMVIQMLQNLMGASRELAPPSRAMPNPAQAAGLIR